MTDRPGYRHRLKAAASELGTMPGISHCTILHDDGCAIFQRQACNCIPDISIIPADGGSVLVIDASGQASKSSKQ
ncbi:hypothetical protein [Bradyrhizobium sp. CSS354]|uniref:hypothetical protein n=1 Tax=Bradyrhizobium sp. CSS354 TaxID=2699172 RepID=UPI0023AFEBA4|nr:hypothetical protein [Bradyrhizobium sp. CSS354]MDE5465227.1 hypothetical protein [Bradyrhizobium sp. CSS354]